MSPFNRLPGTHRSPSGLEWKVLKKLPAVFFYGSALLLGCFVLLRFGVLPVSAKHALIAQYSLIGTMLFHWMCVLGIAFYCAIIWLMKGPAYVMDPYHLPEQSIDSDS